MISKEYYFQVPFGVLISLENLSDKYEDVKYENATESSSHDSADKDNDDQEEKFLFSSFREGYYYKYGKKTDICGKRKRSDEDNEDIPCGAFTIRMAEWLLEQTKGYRVFWMSEKTFFITKHSPTNQITLTRDLVKYHGRYHESDAVTYKVDRHKAFQDPDQYQEYLDIAAKLKPDGSKFTARPGPYAFLCSTEYHEITPHPKLYKLSPWKRNDIPQDLTIVVGEEGSGNQKIFTTNKAICCCFVDWFEQLLVETTGSLEASVMQLPHMDPKKFEDKMTERCDREELRWSPYRPRWMKKTYTTEDIVLKAMCDPKWLDVTFLCVPDGQVVRANRACLASVNPVLKKLLYGDDNVKEDPPQQVVDWSELYEAVAVHKVFQALLRRQESFDEIVVPLHYSESGQRLLDFLEEDAKDLSLEFESIFDEDSGWEGTFHDYIDYHSW